MRRWTSCTPAPPTSSVAGASRVSPRRSASCDPAGRSRSSTSTPPCPRTGRGCVPTCHATTPPPRRRSSRTGASRSAGSRRSGASPTARPATPCCASSSAGTSPSARSPPPPGWRSLSDTGCTCAAAVLHRRGSDCGRTSRRVPRSGRYRRWSRSAEMGRFVRRQVEVPGSAVLALAGGAAWLAGSAALPSGAGTVVLAAGLAVTVWLMVQATRAGGTGRGPRLDRDRRRRVLSLLVVGVGLVVLGGTLLRATGRAELTVPVTVAVGGALLLPLASLLDRRSLIALGAALMLLGAGRRRPRAELGGCHRVPGAGGPGRRRPAVGGRGAAGGVDHAAARPHPALTAGRIRATAHDRAPRRAEQRPRAAGTLEGT